MRRRRTFAPNPDNSLVDGALAALNADELRELILEMLRELRDLLPEAREVLPSVDVHRRPIQLPFCYSNP